jgi:hypothetical protein
MNVRKLVLALAILLATISEPASARQVDSSASDQVADLQVFLMTMGPGAGIHERFGHNAIWIRDNRTGTDIVYNFGMFDFNAPNFAWNFARGRPLYWLEASDLARTLAAYEYFQRRVDVQELALDSSSKAELAYSLAMNALPENREYHYDYYLDNCSTRVRDALDAVLGGALRRHTTGQPAEGNLRWHTQRSISNSAPMYLGILAALGPAVDGPIDQWGEMFLPAKVQERVRELQVTDDAGRSVPLVLREATLVDVDVHSVEPEQPDWTARLLLIGVLLALLVATGFLTGAAGLIGRLLAGLWGVLSGVGGLVLVFLWFFTDHVMTANNLNLLLITPVAFAILPLLLSSRTRPIARRLTSGYFVLVCLGTVLAAMRIGQENREIAALTTPIALTATLVAMGVNRRRAEGPAQLR